MQWISIKDQFPEEDDRYLVVEKTSFQWVGICYFRKGKFDFKITHWQKLPEPPHE